MEQNQTILAVDDDGDILAVLKANLEMYGFAVRTAADIQQARELFSPPPDVLLLDLNLPDGDGIVFCRQIKEEYHDLPVIMLTARDRISDKVIGLDSGADDYVVKPFDTLELLARIRVCLRRAKHPEPIPLVCGDLFVEPAQRLVTIKGVPLELTPKEFDLLCLLMESQGKILSREAIRRALWKDSKIYSWSRVIDVHIQHLRQKIEVEPSSPSYIHTVPGVGYRCCAAQN
ncbi:MAG: response regulator transcription factor [Deltaproteobacteria bacterium]|nr:response regulator transcription factor [Deltaproteobacteria bacterium]